MAKTVLVTGASSGIGRETARQFAIAGYSVAIHYNRNEQGAQSLVDELCKETGTKHNLLTVQADIKYREQVDRMFSDVKHTFGAVDILVNNAGIAQTKLFTDITQQDFDEMFDTNVKGIFHCTQAVLPDMISRKEGKIINISSIWGIAGASMEVHYSAAKAAVIGMTKALASELGPSNIHVNCVAPGVVQTPMLSEFSENELAQLSEDAPLGRLGTPLDIANTILFLASDKSDFITGQVISPNGGLPILNI